MNAITYQVFAILILTGSVFAQNHIQGEVKNENGEPIPFANILLLNASDSLLAKGSVSGQEGEFKIEGINTGKYFLVGTMVGYKKKAIPVFEITGAQHISIGTLVLEEATEELNEVVVRAEKPLYEQRMDRLDINVENSVTLAGSTVLEVLERSPGISVNRQSNSLSMGGKQGVLLMVNGKIQRLPMEAVVQMLGGMSASTIKKVELISNPSAKYDAQGDAGIINIVTKENEGLGTTGSLTATMGYGWYGKPSVSIGMNHRGRNFNVYGNYSGVYDKLWQKIDYERSIYNPDQQINTISNRYVHTPMHQARIGFEWTLGKKTSMNALFSGYDNKWDMEAYSSSHIVQRGLDSAQIAIYDRVISHWENRMGNFNIIHVFKEGQSLNLDVDYLYYHNDMPRQYINDYLFLQDNSARNDRIRIDKDTPINMGVVKLDYRSPYKSGSFEMGLKTTFSRLNNNILLENLMLSEWITDPVFTQDYTMKDDVLAAYVNMSGKIAENGKFQLGLRTEHTDMEIISGGTNKVFDLNFWSLFPTAFYSFQINSNNAIQLSYGRRITRPSYQDIAPFVLFIDPYNYYKGNPKLKPAITDGLQATFSHKEIMVSIKYSHDKNAIANFQSKFDPKDKRSYGSAENIDRTHAFSMTFGIPITLSSWWKAQTNFMGIYQVINTLYQDVPVNIQQFSGQFNASTTFSLPKKYTVEVSGMYWTPSRLGIALQSGFGQISLGIQKKLKNNLDLFSLNISDIFWTNVMRLEVRKEAINLNQSFSFLSEPRIVRLSFTKAFGNKSVKSAKVRATASEAEQQRVK